MHDDGLVILSGDDVAALLAGREAEVTEAVEKAYLAHAAGKSSLPHSTFLRFPGDAANRIIALPAFLGEGFEVAGVKWVSSFPANVHRRMARASAILVLNDCESGLPVAVFEGSLISARRTAASAALGARLLLAGRAPGRVGIIGAGLINFEIARFLHVLHGAASFLLYDLDASRAGRFAVALGRVLGDVETGIANSTEEVLSGCSLTSFATTAAHPHVRDLSMSPPDAVILHVSLRDLAPEVILACDNVVDDVDHVCRAQTSLHLAEQATGRRDFIRCTLADVLRGDVPARRGDGSIAVFSPFGLGILDVALGKLVLDGGRGTHIASFLPDLGEFPA
ncbi:MAG TPA: 2,3-diaminopropionate biosynthesis protein SbnB [Thermoanaerobaculia bacterium]|nr:2,3-diaminopropionate biosynthesis protein SbnB [Thermoanaerobaculia bacterium]